MQCLTMEFMSVIRNQASVMPALGLVKANTMALFALFARGWENEQFNMGLLVSPNHCHLPRPIPCQLVEQLNDSMALIKQWRN